MKTYKIKAGANRNTPSGRHFIQIDDGEEQMFIANIPATATIRFFQISKQGGSLPVLSATVDEIVKETSGL